MEKGFTKDLIDRIKLACKFSAIELPVKEVVKLEDVALVDGSILSVDKMEVGSKAMLTGVDGISVDADGTFETQDGTMIICIAGLVTEIKSKEVEAPIAPEAVSEMSAFKSRLEALEAKYVTNQTQLSETKKHLGTALEAIEKISDASVAVALEAQKPTKKVKAYEDMTRYEQLLFNRGKI